MSKKISGKPNKEQRKFILRRLIPAILRENGKAFAMSEWHENFAADDIDYFEGKYEFDNVLRAIPSCGTVCCIGGTAQILLYPTSRVKGWSQRVMGNLAKAMGLTFEEAHGLFFNWTDNDDFRGVNECEWPKNFRDAFADRKTARGKANVAVCLLRKIADEGGKCLHIQRDTES